MRAILFALVVAIPSLAPAQSRHATALDAIRSWAMAGTEPILAEPSGPASTDTSAAAIVQLTVDSVAIVVARHTGQGLYDVVARSKGFTLSREANFGAWIEQFRFITPERIELSLTSRNGCARSVTTHRFVLRSGTWLVSGLDTSAPRCTEKGVELHWTETSNYFTGKTVRTTFTPSKRPKTTQVVGMRRPFPLSQFPPDGPEAAYADLR